MTIITLSNGKRVGNFSSPHPFEFTDGSIIPAVSPEEAKRLEVTFIETIADNGDVSLVFELSHDVLMELQLWEGSWIMSEVDIVFCCLPMIIALRERGYNIKSSPFRAVRIEDRIKKLISIGKQCL